MLCLFWTLPAAALMRFGFGYRIEGLSEIRSQFQRIRSASTSPLLICANHLTLIDSFLIAWALTPSWRYILDFSSLPWNTPERENFAANWRSAVFVYVAKCIPIRRGGTREETANVISRVQHLLSRGETALLFPEGGRSRTGRVELESAAWGVGRIVASLPDCRVLCVYMRGRSQDGWGERPKNGEIFEVQLACIEPKTESRGARSWRDLSRQIVSQLANMEAAYFESAAAKGGDRGGQ